MRRRLLLLGAAVCLSLGSSLVFEPVQAEPAASIDDSGWWWRAQTNPQVLLPPPPNVSEGQLLVQSGPDGAMALAAVAATLVEGEASPKLSLKVAPNSSAGAEAAVVLACQAGAAWKGGDAQVWSEAPPPGCQAGGVAGAPSDDGTSWTFDLTRLQFDDQVNVVIVPGVVEGLPEGANYPTFSLTFEAPTAASIETTPGQAPAPPTTPSMDPGVIAPDLGSGAGSFDSPPIGGGGFDPPPVAAVPGVDQTLTPVAPSVQAGQPLLPASTLVDPRSPNARAVGVLLLLLGGAAVYWMTRQQRPVGPEGIPGGLGRWATPRWGTPPSLRG